MRQKLTPIDLDEYTTNGFSDVKIGGSSLDILYEERAL